MTETHDRRNPKVFERHPMSFGEWLAARPFGDDLPSEATAFGMEAAWHAALRHAPCQCFGCKRERGEDPLANFEDSGTSPARGDGDR